VMVFMKIVLFF